MQDRPLSLPEDIIQYVRLNFPALHLQLVDGLALKEGIFQQERDQMLWVGVGQPFHEMVPFFGHMEPPELIFFARSVAKR
jgi:hypothetical protein